MMSDVSLSKASGIGWEQYYRAIEGRSARALFVDALRLFQTRPTDDRGLVAIDLGCGDGTETLALLAHGYTVIAIDSAPEALARLRAAVTSEDAAGLTTFVAAFHELALPAADFIYAGLSLPFCDPRDFGETWRRISTAVRADGIFAGHFFGPHDTWAHTPGMTFHKREEVEALFDGFEIRVLIEEDEDGAAVSGPKHWHVFHVIATKRDPN